MSRIINAIRSYFINQNRAFYAQANDTTDLLVAITFDGLSPEVIPSTPDVRIYAPVGPSFGLNVTFPSR